MAFTTRQAGAQTQQLAVPEQYTGDAQELARSQRLAQLLSGQQMPEGQMVSGRYVAPSWTQQLAGLVNAGTGAYFADKAETQQQALARKIREGEAATIADFMATKQGRPAVAEQVTEMAGPYTGNVPMPTATIEGRAATPANPQMAYSNLYEDPRASTKLRDFAFNKMMADPEEITMAEGATRFVKNPDGSYKEVATGGAKVAPEIRQAMQFLGIDKPLNQLTPQELQAIENKAIAFKKAGATNINLPSEGERKAGFMSNILDRNILQMQTALGVDPTAVKPNVAASVVESVTGPNLLSRSMKPAQRQIVEDSQLDVLDAALTLRTGAAYTREQLNAMRDTYFPVLGDKPQAVTAKKQRLETLLEGAYINAGRATPSRVSAPPPPAPPPNNSIAGNAQQTNLPKISGPRFLGFETPQTGQ
jgi:hypothetical protein